MNANISERVKQRYLLAIFKEQATGIHEDFTIIARLSPSVTEEESSAVFHDYQQLGQETVDYRLLISELDATR
jgi:2,4-dienoyl-CoA reductase-like NADH-dependent reductase (Old Yellow Enzyme family)